jgi:hypothetical protein
MIAYCTRVSQDPRSVRYLFDGNVLNPEGSAESLNVEDGGEIDAMLSQIGGDKHRHYNKLLYTPIPSPALPPHSLQLSTAGFRHMGMASVLRNSWMLILYARPRMFSCSQPAPM